MMGNLPNAAAPADPATLEKQKKQRIWEALNGGTGAMPQDIGQGIAALGNAFAARKSAQDTMFPAAPGGGQADWATNMRNLFTFGRNGGLY